ncbi:unnamed protein product [Rotaria sordida]|uniref:Meckelin n=1 Tax=Rotaria sordida TaxID=392033 RepID=A0A814AB76_9BILA|nr:unnamed protein product [Rotaria sordida]CAF3571465.1 unnamed protein product [Rotaria sordida]
MDLENHTRNVWIALGTLSGLGMIVATIQTWAWFSKSGKEIIDLPTLGKFLLHFLGILSTVIFLVMAGVSVWWLIFFKKQYDSTFESKTSSQQNIFKILFIVSFILKTVDIIHLILRQTTIDIFFIDWERSKTGNSNTVSAWRTCFVANEFNEIQTFRRIHVPFHLLSVLFFLKVINLENIALADTDIILFPSSSFTANCTMEYNSIFRIGTAFLVLLGTAIIQYLFYIIFYQRLIGDKIINFIDLCSVSNISIIILDQIYHGYYIHGRSPHGISDVNIKDIIMNLERESRSMSGTRGLQANSIEQIFIMKINKTFRAQYDLLFRQYYDYIGPRRKRKDIERRTDILFQSYQNLNRFLCAYIDRSLPTYQYFIRNRYLLEKIFNYEFQTSLNSGLSGNMDNLLFIDNEKIFTKILFYGEENSLFIWNTITFLFIDFISSNYVLAAIITFLLNLIAVGLRNSFGRRNLSKKTLIPRELLI